MASAPFGVSRLTRLILLALAIQTIYNVSGYNKNCKGENMELIRNLTAEEVDRNTIFTGQSVIGFSDRTIEGKTFTNACGALEMHPDGKP